MKKIYVLLYLAMGVFAIACTPEEEDFFGDSSANRADAAVKTTFELLTTPSNGWVMEYFPESLQKYGGFYLLLAFDKEGRVKIAGELADPEDIETSLYTVKQSAGIILSFDTYNSIFHFFSDPSDPSGAGGRGKGLEGDYDFLVLESSAEKIVLKGKKSSGYAIMTPMAGDWEDFISEIQDADEAMAFARFKLELNGEEIPVSVSFRTLTFTYMEDESKIMQTASYIVTKTGYKFYAPIVIKGATLSGFTFDPKNNWFTEYDNPAVKLIPLDPPLNEQFVRGRWYIAYSTLGAFAQPYYTTCKQNFFDPEGEKLNYVVIGSFHYRNYGFNFKSDNYQGFLGFDYELAGEDKITLIFNELADQNGAWYYNNAGFRNLLIPFCIDGTHSFRTFTLTTDDTAEPTIMTLTDDGNPTNVITLHKSQVLFPYDN